MATLILGAEVYDPEPRGRADALIVGERLLRLQPGLERLAGDPRLVDLLSLEVVEAHGRLLLPGLIDGHVHLLGGGGEGGPTTRTPELDPATLAAAGITTVVGLLGFDAVTRHVSSLLAKARAVADLGFSSRIYTGAYEVPVQTLTGSVERDIVLVEEIIGVGEVAIADARSSWPSAHELARLAAGAHTGGSLSGKAGVLHLHVGDGRSGLGPLWDLLNETDLPAHCLFPTHVNRSPALLREAAAFARHGAFIDLTATVAPDCDEPGSLAPDDALAFLLAAGAPPDRITMSSDGNGSMPVFDGAGNLTRVGVGSVTLLWERVRRAVLQRAVGLPSVLATVTRNPARALRLLHKGRLLPGADADLLLVSPDLRIEGVMARGRWVWSQGRSHVLDPFAAGRAMATAGDRF